jgi:hypothetical protein
MKAQGAGRKAKGKNQGFRRPALVPCALGPAPLFYFENPCAAWLSKKMTHF